MGRARTRIARSRASLPHRILMDPAALRYWLAVATCAALAAGVVWQATASAGRARARWGPGRPVLVTDGPVQAGTELLGRVHAVEWPATLRPRHALAHLPADAVAVVDLPAGAPVLAGSLRTGRLAERGARTVAVPTGSAVLPVHPGAEVDVWAATDAGDLGPDPEPTAAPVATRIAAGAAVVSVGEDAAIIAVRGDEVAAVTAAVAAGTATLAGHP